MQVQVPLARLEEDLNGQRGWTLDEGARYLPDNLFWFMQGSYGDRPQEQKNTYFLTDDKFNILKQAYLNPEQDNQDQHISKQLSAVVVDGETGNVDYNLYRTLKCLGCCRPFRTASLMIRSSNGIDLFTLSEAKRDQFVFSPILGQKYTIQRSKSSGKLFEILDGQSARVGSIKKSWTALNHRIRTADGHYHIRFNENGADLGDDVKYILLLNVFLLDFLFQDPASRKEDTRRRRFLCCC